MLHIENGYKLYTSQPSNHDFRYQAVPAPVRHNITAPFDPNNAPPFMINDMNETIRIIDYYDSSTDPTMEEVTSATFSFRMLSEPQRVYTLSSAQSELYPGVWFPAINGSPQTGRRGSAVPLRFCVTTTIQTGHIREDGSVYYTTDSPFVAYKGQYGNGIEWLVPRDNEILDNYNGMLLLPLSITQEDKLFTVSGGEQ